MQLSFSNTVAIHQHVKSGRLRALAVAGPKRTDVLPDVPTMKEAGVEGVEVPLWFGLLAPAGTPREIVQLLATNVAKAAHSPDLHHKLVDQGADPVGNTHRAEFSIDLAMFMCALTTFRVMFAGIAGTNTIEPSGITAGSTARVRSGMIGRPVAPRPCGKRDGSSRS